MIRVCRNDDVCADTTLHEIRTFCELCDRYGVTPMHAITPIGNVRAVQKSMDNATIRRVSGTALFSENREVIEYLKGRSADQFAVHGLWHTHEPTAAEISEALTLIRQVGFNPQVFVAPFNEGNYITGRDIGLWVSGADAPRLEEFLEAGEPGAEIVYLHTNRFWPSGPFTFDQLDRCLKRLTAQ